MAHLVFTCRFDRALRRRGGIERGVGLFGGALTRRRNFNLAALTRRVDEIAARLSASALVCAASSAMRLPSAGLLRCASIARSILSSRPVKSGATGPFCAAAGEGGGFGAGFDGAAGADKSDAAVPTGAASRNGMTPVNQSAAAAHAITAAPMSALAICDTKRRPVGAEAGAFEPALACSAAPVMPASASPAAGLSAEPSTSVAANSMVGGRRGVWSSVSLMCPF